MSLHSCKPCRMSNAWKGDKNWFMCVCMCVHESAFVQVMQDVKRLERWQKLIYVFMYVCIWACIRVSHARCQTPWKVTKTDLCVCMCVYELAFVWAMQDVKRLERWQKLNNVYVCVYTSLHSCESCRIWNTLKSDIYIYIYMHANIFIYSTSASAAVAVKVYSN